MGETDRGWALIIPPPTTCTLPSTKRTALWVFDIANCDIARRPLLQSLLQVLVTVHGLSDSEAAWTALPRTYAFTARRRQLVSCHSH